MRRACIAALACLLATAAAARDEAGSCEAEIGRRRASALALQCREVSPASRPPCNGENSCEVVRSEIRRGCEGLGADAPPFCEAYVETDDDEEDE